MGIPQFRGVFMRDNLPKHPWKHECAIVNLDTSRGSGTHWIAYWKRGNDVEYFDSFGNLKPPLELIEYLGRNCTIYYNRVPFQEFNTVICGHLCIQFLFNKTGYK